LRYLPSIRVVPAHCLPGLADADRVTHGVAGIEDEIKPALVGLHHDRAGV